MAPNLDTLVENVITCPVCLKHFDQPRMLPCLHTFCFQCIQQMTLQNNGLLECPNHDGTTVEENAIGDLPSNEDLCKLMQLIDRPTSVVPKCYRCDNTDAEYWCESDCKHGFCGRCWDSIHETGQYRSHTKLPIKDKPPEMPACKDHTPEEEKGIYWCEGCSKEICGNCQQLKHKDHKFIIITDFVKDVQQQQENGLQSVQLCLNYRTDRADKMVTEIEDESKINQEKVTTTMATLRQLIDRQEEALLAKIRNEEQNDKKPIQEHKKNLQSEQQGLIRQILDVVAMQKDKQPKKLLEAKRTFEDYVTNMNARLVELKPWTRKKRQIFGIDKVNELQRTIENMELAEEPKYTNDKLQQIINNSTDKSKLSLVNLQLKDMDMEIVANEMAMNKALKTLELYTNQIGDLGAQTLADALRENTTLTNLQLHENQIGSDGLEHFADALRTNKSLDKLALYKNNITDETAQEIADGLKLNEKMEKQIREINVIPRPTYTNPALTQRIANNGNNTTLDLRSSNYTDDDMLIVADMLKDNTVVTYLALYENQIGDSGAQFLSELLKVNKKLTRVDLYTNKIGDLGAQYLADALKANTTLQDLRLYNNKIGDDGATHLAESLKVNQTLTVLYLNQNQIGDQGAQHLGDALKTNQKLQQLYLHQNQIGDQGAQHLAEGLKLNNSLTVLYLSDNKIGDQGAQKLADALKVNKVLQRLYLNNNQIGDNGAQYLANGLRENRTIQYLYLPAKVSANVRTQLKQQDNRIYFSN